MSQKAIRAALEGAVKTWATAHAIAVAWENAPFTPTAGTAYARVNVLPADTIAPDLAGDARTYRGVLQVALAMPINVGPGAAAALADSLGTAIPVNTLLTSGGVTVQIVSPASAAPALQEDDRYIVPVSLGYYASVTP